MHHWWHIDAAESHAGDFRVGISLSQVVQLCIKQVVQLCNKYVLQRCHYSSLLAAFVSLTCSFTTSVFLKLCVCLTVIKKEQILHVEINLDQVYFHFRNERLFCPNPNDLVCLVCEWTSAITQCIFPRKLMLSKIFQCIGCWLFDHNWMLGKIF